MKNVRNNPDQYPIDSNNRSFNNDQLAFIGNAEEVGNIELHLESLGCTDIEIGKTYIDFEYQGETLQIDRNAYTHGCTMKKLLNNAYKYTCCGDLIEYDGDSDICPTCKEHC